MYTGRYPMGLRVGHDGVGEGPPRPAPRPGRARAHHQLGAHLNRACAPGLVAIRDTKDQGSGPVLGESTYSDRAVFPRRGTGRTVRRDQAWAGARLCQHGPVSRIAYVSGRLGAGKSSLAAPLADHRGHNRAGRRRVRRRRSPPPARLLAAVQADLPGGGRAPGGADPFGDVGGPVAAGEDWCASRLSTHEGIGPLLGNSEREQARNCGRAGAERPM